MSKSIQISLSRCIALSSVTAKELTICLDYKIGKFRATHMRSCLMFINILDLIRCTDCRVLMFVFVFVFVFMVMVMVMVIQTTPR